MAGMVGMSLEGGGRLLRGPESGKRSDAAAAARAVSVSPLPVFRLRRGAGQDDKSGARDRSSQAGCSRWRSSDRGHGCASCRRLRDPVCGRTSVVAPMTAHPGTWAVDCGGGDPRLFVWKRTGLAGGPPRSPETERIITRGSAPPPPPPRPPAPPPAPDGTPSPPSPV